MGFEFGNVQELNSRITLITFIAVVAFVVFFDFLVGLMEYFLSGSQLYNRMIQLIYKELMLMGLVSFTIIMAEGLEKNSKTHSANYERWIAGIEFSHILIFYLTFFFVAHAFYLMRTSVVCSRKYRQRFCEKPKHLIDKLETQSEREKLFYGLTYMPFQDLRTRVEFQLIHFLFNETYLLSEGFNFASYLSGCFDRYALKTINRSMFTWFILMVLSVLNYGRILAGFGFHTCRGPIHPEAGAHRLLGTDHSSPPDHPDAYYSDAGSSSAPPHEEGVMIGSVVCSTMNVKLFVFMAILLVVYTFVLVFVSRMYKLRLINRIGFKGPQDYLKFLKFAEENKLSNQERMTPAQLKKEIEAVMDADEYQSEEESEFREIGEFLKLIVDSIYELINNFILDSKIFLLSLVKPSRVSTVKSDTSILMRKTEAHVEKQAASAPNHQGQLSHIRSTLANTSSHFHSHNSGHFDHHRSSSATDDTELMRSNKSIGPPPIHSTPSPHVAGSSAAAHSSPKPAFPSPSFTPGTKAHRGTVINNATTSAGLASIVALKNLKANEERSPTQTTTTPKFNPTLRRMSVGKKEPSPIMDMLMQNVEGDEVDPDKFLQRPGKSKDSPAAPAAASLRSRSSSHEDGDLVMPYNEHVGQGSPSQTAQATAKKSINLALNSASAPQRRSNHRSTIMAKQAGGAIEKFNILEHQKSVQSGQVQSSDDEAAGAVHDGAASEKSDSAATSAAGSPNVKRASFTVVSALSASANRAKRTTMAVKQALPPKDLAAEPPQGFFRRTYLRLERIFRNNKVAADVESGMNKNQKKLEEEEKNSFIDMYLFGKPLLFFRAVELCIMFNCLYLAFWVTNFIVIDVKLEETYGWRVVGQIAMAVPLLFVIPSIGYIAETCSLLTAVSELNLEVVHAVLVETEDVTILVNELRLKMLQRISSVETADVKKMDIIHGLFSEIDKDGSGCIDHTEFRLLLKALKLTYSDQRFKRLYRAVDADGDNKIGYGEIDLLLNPPNLHELLQNDMSNDVDDEFDEDDEGGRETTRQGGGSRRESQSTKLMDRLKHEKSAAFAKSSHVQAFKNADSKPSTMVTGKSDGWAKPVADEMV